MDSEYKDIYRQAISLQNRFRDITRGTNHPAADGLEREIDRIVEDIEAKVNPRSLESRITALQHRLKDTERQNQPPLTQANMDDFHDRYEQIRQALRKFSNY